MGPIRLSHLRGTSFGVHEHAYKKRDVSIHSLGAGCDTEDLEHIYEQHPHFQALPTFVCASGLPATSLLPLPDILPRYDEAQRLHAEQFLMMEGPIPSNGTLIHKPTLVDLAEKGRAAAVVCGVRTTTAAGAPVAYSEFTTFALGAGGFEVDEAAGAGISERPAEATAANAPPDRPSDAVISERICGNQAALYRLSGDENPLHIDPGAARRLGFERPILHGLCTLAVAARRLQTEFGRDGTLQLRTLKARFAGHVFPGETLRIEAWQQEAVGGGRNIVFRATTAKRGKPVLTHAALQLAPRLASKL